MAGPIVAKTRATSLCGSDLGGSPLAFEMIEKLRSSDDLSVDWQEIHAGPIETIEIAVRLQPGQLGFQS